MGTVVSKHHAGRRENWLLQTLENHESGINCMTLSDDTSVLATGSDDNTIRLWSTRTESVEYLTVLAGHADYITHIVILDSYLVSSSADHTIRKWDMPSARCVFICTGHTSIVNRITCTEELIFSTSYDRTARCWDYRTGTCIRTFHGHHHGLLPLLFIPANRDAEEESTFEEEMNIYTKDILITGSQDLTAKTWSLKTGDCLKTFEGHVGAVLCLATDAQGKVLFTGSGDNTIRVWDIYRGNELRIYDLHQAPVINILVANKLLYSLSADHTVRCWIIDVGDCIRIYKGHHHSVSCIQLENDLVFTGCGDAIVRCFEARSGVMKRAFKSHELAVNCIQIVDDRLFSGSVDGSLKVWDISDLRSRAPPDPKSKLSDNSREKTDAESGIDNHKYRERRVQNMV
ncbi:unnamed protein product [Adineta ricciae]|uniref:WD repeat-containing protein 86 n=1 Tax=Adineta ricciae TaxID=249248 RepID=A0A814AEU9_ADIRI|nr:unnamed protein product [Adineta ricciae]CAF0958187.1 unnamed protein product [Adineta ricciae]